MATLYTRMELKTIIEGIDECLEIFKPQITTFQIVKYHNYCRIRDKLKATLTEMILNNTETGTFE